ncbi:MAG: S9 family peptidase, partial [Pyrinomonadaceae bacterium]
MHGRIPLGKYRLLWFAIAGLFLNFVGSSALRAQDTSGKKPITHESMWLMKRVGPPVPSPDGRWVVFSLIEPAYDDKDQVSDLWLVPADGSAKSRRLTFSKGSESGPAWSPDSRRLAFSAKREGDEVNQIYMIDVAAGGEAVRVTSLSTGARLPQWRPDGKALLFVSSVYPSAADDETNKKIAAERKAQKHKARVYDSFPIRNWDKWLEDTQPHIFVQTLDADAKAKDLLAGTKLISEPGFGGSLGTSGDEINAVWSPDGQSIVFVATSNRNVSAYASSNTLLYEVPATGGEPLAITTGPSSFAQPAFRPDGKALYLTVTAENDRVYNLSRMAMIPWPASAAPGAIKILTENFDRAVGSFASTPDSKTVYFLAEESGHEKLFSVSAAGGEVRPALEMAEGVYTNLRIPSKAPTTILIANWESAVNPNEVVRIKLQARRHDRLTDFNVERAAQIDWQPLKHVWFINKTGTRIHSMLALPPNFDERKKYPLLVLIHGGPHTMWRDQFFLRWNYHLLAQPGYVVLLTDYRGSTGYGEKFAQAIQEDPFIGPSADLN